MRGAEEVQVVGPTIDIGADFFRCASKRRYKVHGFNIFSIISHNRKAAAEFSSADFFFFSLIAQTGKTQANVVVNCKL